MRWIGLRALACLALLAAWPPQAAPARDVGAVEDDLFWEDSGGCEDIEGARLYLEVLPEGRHAGEAAGCIAWDGLKGCEKGKKGAVERFLADFSESRHAGEARACLDRLEADEDRDRRIERLLSECRAHREAGRLTAGSGGNAVECYRRALDEDPGNARALDGIAEIERHYVDKAEEALGRERPGAAGRAAARLEAISPEHPAVETLNVRVEDLKRELAERERLAAERRELVREVEGLLEAGKPEDARSRLAAGRKRGLSGKALAALEARVGEALAEAERSRALAARAAEVRSLAGSGKIGEARARLAEARAEGLDEGTASELEAAIGEAEARAAAAARAAEAERLLAECADHGSARRFGAALGCYREVLALAPANEDAAAGVRRFGPLAAWDEVSGRDTVEGYYGYERLHEGSMFARLARRRLKKLEAAYWKEVLGSGTPSAYGRYLEIYPEGRFAGLARRRMGDGH